MHTGKRAGHLVNQPFKPQTERGAATDQHVVATRFHVFRARQPHDLPQPSPYPIALDRITDLLRHRIADARRRLIASLTRLQYEAGAVCLGAGCRCDEIRPLPQPVQGRRHENQADRRLRPRARRALITLRPPLVAMRARKP